MEYFFNSDALCNGVDNLNLQVISENDLLYSETSKAVNGFLNKSDLSK